MRGIAGRPGKQEKKFMPGVGFEPTRTKRPADLKSAPLDPSGIQAKYFPHRETHACHKEIAKRNKNKKVSLEGLEPPIF